jgi:hypothetical protein
MTKLELKAGDQTEELLRFITNELDDEVLDTIEIEREGLRSDKLATEPLTVAATLTLATTTVVIIGRLIERWLENKKQIDQLDIVAEGFKQSDEAGKALSVLAKMNAKVSIAYGILKPPRQGNEKTSK